MPPVSRFPRSERRPGHLYRDNSSQHSCDGSGPVGAVTRCATGSSGMPPEKLISFARGGARAAGRIRRYNLPGHHPRQLMLTRTLTVALVGNPNTGKTTLFNALTGLRQHVGNYPGVTVELKKGRARLGERVLDIVDLPGTYSLAD